MLAYLYPIGFLASLLGLISWFYFKDNPQRSNLMSKMFLGGFFVYLFSLAFAEGELTYKLFVLFRDLLILGLVSNFFNFFIKNKLLFVTMLAILFGAFKFFGYEKLTNTFPQKIIKENSNTIPTISKLEGVDPNWELLVELSENHKMSELQNLIDKYQLTYEAAFQMNDAASTELDDYVVVNIPDAMESKTTEIIAALQAAELTDWVEENELVNVDPMEQIEAPKTKVDFDINDPSVKELWGFEKMNVDKLYKTLAKAKIKPKRKAIIAILDTGVDSKHEDIKANFTSTKTKYDNDPQSHGTHCAGIAAAVSNNGKGVASFSKNNEFVQVTSVRVLSPYGGGTQRGIINGMIEAADKGVDVISMSLGGRSNSSRQKAYSKAVKYCNDKGAIVVVAAGNSNMDAKDYSPANAAGVITVSAIDSDMNRAVFSNYIQNVKMGVAAPGVGIYSTIPDNKYAAYNGTSMATPYVAGLLGLMKAIYPKLSTKEAYNILKSSGKDTNNTKETGKLIQPEAAVKELLD